MIPDRRPSRRWRLLARVLAWGAMAILAFLAGLAALLATAVWTARPVLFLAAGWAIFALGLGGAARLAFGPRWRWPVVAGAAAVLSALIGGALLWPARSTLPPAPAGVAWVRLPSGVRLAYLHLRATGTAHATKVIFVHGGPGLADMTGDARYLREVAADGYDVYLFDQLGAGQSSRLANPLDYTLARGVADLELFRRAIHARRVDLIAYSWGARLVDAYLTKHAGHVVKVVFVSPDAISGEPTDPADLLRRLDGAHRRALLRQALVPRAMLAWLLVQVNPRAAHAFAGDAEMDAWFRAVIAAGEPAFYCRPPPATSGGHPGFYVLAMLMGKHAWHGADPHQVLRRLRTPVLILKGQCDYLSWASAIDYRDTFANSRLIYMPGAGHRLFAERPRAFATIVAAFFAGHALPMAAATGSHPPPGYDGPAEALPGAGVGG